jgi:uncharacterized OsmC-like protein
MNQQSMVMQRQAPLRAAYKEHPEQALIVKRAWTVFDMAQDAFHGVVVPGEPYRVSWAYGTDRAIGGFHDAPNPGELLCAALAACQDATLRMVADLLGVKLRRVEVEVTGKVDVRGSMAVDRQAPVGFQSLECKVRFQAAPGTPPELCQRLIQQAERSCINLHTLRAGVSVDASFEVRDDASAPIGATA